MPSGPAVLFFFLKIIDVKNVVLLHHLKLPSKKSIREFHRKFALAPANKAVTCNSTVID